MFSLRDLLIGYRGICFGIAYFPPAKLIDLRVSTEELVHLALDDWNAEAALLTHRHHHLMRRLAEEGAIRLETAEMCISGTDLNDIKRTLVGMREKDEVFPRSICIPFADDRRR